MERDLAVKTFYMTNANESAYPEVNHDNPQFSYPTYGLTKREYFAAAALQGICSVFSGSPNAEKQAQKAGKTLSELIAIYSIDIADAMIDSLNQKENG